MKKRWLIVLLCALMLVLTACGGVEQVEEEKSHRETEESAEETWENNVLMNDAVPFRGTEHWDWDEEASAYPVLGSAFKREQIKTVTVLDTLEEAPEDAWDVSADGNENVMAWVQPNGDLYDLYIAAEDGINAENACEDLFAGYVNAETITFGEGFHTDAAEDMTRMFFGCFSLKELDLSSFETGKVKDMSYMFCYCLELEKLDVSGFNTGRVRDMRSMFSWCQSVEELELSGFSTRKVQNMKEMFYSCESLQSLDLSSFDTSKAEDTTDMFTGCSAGDDWSDLLN